MISRPESLVFSGDTTNELKVSLLITGTSPTSRVYRVNSGSMVELTLETQPRFQSTFSGTKFELTISDLSRGDAGQYMVVATNGFGADNITIMIAPQGKSVRYENSRINQCTILCKCLLSHLNMSIQRIRIAVVSHYNGIVTGRQLVTSV